MTEETFDFEGEEAWDPSGQILPPDWMGQVVVEDIEPGETRNTNPQVLIQLKATSGEGGIRDWITLTPNSLGHWLQVCQAFGVENPGKIAIRDTEDRDEKFPTGRPSKEWNEHLLKFGGKTCYIRTFLDTSYDPQGKTKVQNYSPVPLGSDVPADTRELGNGQQTASDKSLPF